MSKRGELFMGSKETIDVVIVGAGGLGTPAAWGLVSNWSENKTLNLKIYDADLIEISNLNRQVLFGKSDLGKNKAEVLSQKLLGLYNKKNINITPFNFNITKENIDKNLENSSFVLDATDSVNTKFLINDYCVINHIPFCYAGSVKTSGQLLFVNPKIENNGCLRCLFGNFSEEEFLCQDASCQQAGIFGPAVGIIGSLQSEYLIKMIDNPSLTQGGSIFHSFELLSMHQNKADIQPNNDCPLACKFKKNKILDLRLYRCPKTFLYTKLALEQMSNQEILDLRFSSEESVKNVILSAREEGHLNLTNQKEIANGIWRVLIQRGH